MAPACVRSVDALLGEEPSALTDEALRQHLRELVQARSRLAAAEAEAIVEMDARKAYIADGAITSDSWLRHQTAVSLKSAASRVTLARKARRMPLLRDAWRAGEVNEGHINAMGRAITPRTLDAFVRDEEMLVEHARALDVDDFQHVVARWLEANDQDGPNQRSKEPSEMWFSPVLDGRHSLRGDFDLEDSAIYGAELDALYDELYRQDKAADDSDPLKRRTPAQRRAAAAIEMARRSSAAGDRDDDPDDGTPVTIRRSPRKPLLIVRVDVEALEGKQSGTAELDDGTTVWQDVLQRWMCDSGICRVVMVGGSVPVDLGKITYTASDGQRRALKVRDEGCIVPGCKRKARWCEAHHVVPWPTGPTNLNNLVLLCYRHHKQVHARVIELVPAGIGKWTVVRGSDGTPLRERPPPRLAA